MKRVRSPLQTKRQEKHLPKYLRMGDEAPYAQLGFDYPCVGKVELGYGHLKWIIQKGALYDA